MNIIKTFICASSVIFLLAGCSSKPPGCSDEKTTALVRSIFADELATGVLYTPEKLSKAIGVGVSTVHTVETDKSNKTQCEGRLEVQLPSGAMAVIEGLGPTTLKDLKQQFSLKIDEGGKAVISKPILYSSSLTDDKKEHVVQLSGHEGIVDAIVILNRWGILAATSQTPKVESASNQKTGPRTVIRAVILGLECGDLCHLKYGDRSENVLTALCGDDKLCRKWADDPQAFKKVVGSEATLMIVKEFIPEANTALDSISAITITRASYSQ
jgi:hypothetical protein